MTPKPFTLPSWCIPRLLDCSKTQHRVLVTPQPEEKPGGGYRWGAPRSTGAKKIPGGPQFCSGGSAVPLWDLIGEYSPFRVGEVRWVREAWCQKLDDSGYLVYTADGEIDASCCHYKADGYEVFKGDGDGGTAFTKSGKTASPWLSGARMPRYAARLFLRVVSVRCEKVIAISEADAEAEGCFLGRCSCMAVPQTVLGAKFLQTWCHIHGQEFKAYWEARHPGSWERGDYVWVPEFERVEGP